MLGDGLADRVDQALDRPDPQLVERLIHGHLVTVKLFPPSVELAMDAHDVDDYADPEEQIEQERLTWY